MKITKPWGEEELIEVNDKYAVKRLTMKAKHRCSLQYHEYKRETIYVIYGLLRVKIGDEYKILNSGDTLTIKPKEIHRMEAINDDVIYLECSTNQLDDVIRIKDDYNR